MRSFYVDLIKQYIHANPEYKNTLKELRANIASLGATEEEFEEALRQTGIPSSLTNALIHEEEIPPKKPAEKNQLIPNKLVEVDIMTHIVALGLLVIIGGVFLFQTFNTNPQNPKTIVTKPYNSSSFKVENVKNLIAQHVYANSTVVDADKIFSYPASDVTLSITGEPKKEIFGFFPYWMLEQQDKISLNALTTVSLFGLEVDGEGNIVTKNNEGNVDPGWAMWNDPKLAELLSRARKRRIKTQLTLKAFNNENIEKLVASNEAQLRFISNALHLMNTKTIDGINLDFEYVGTPSENTREGFTRLVQNLRSELKRQLPNASLTVCTYISSASVLKLIDVEILANFVDSFIIMGYDIHTPKGEPGPIAPMEGIVSIVGFMQSYLNKVPADKLILAVPYYGYDWSVPNTSNDTRILPYAIIAQESKNSTIQWDDISQTPSYAYKDSESGVDRVVHFENTRSLALKYDYINSKNLRGVGIWALGYDGLNGDLRTLLYEKFSDTKANSD